MFKHKSKTPQPSRDQHDPLDQYFKERGYNVAPESKRRADIKAMNRTLDRVVLDEIEQPINNDGTGSKPNSLRRRGIAVLALGVAAVGVVTVANNGLDRQIDFNQKTGQQTPEDVNQREQTEVQQIVENYVPNHPGASEAQISQEIESQLNHDK